jgi:hypothetical protein
MLLAVEVGALAHGLVSTGDRYRLARRSQTDKREMHALNLGDNKDQGYRIDR